MISWADVVTIAPHLASFEARRQETILGIVERQTSPSLWGDRRDDGMIFLAAHLGTLSARAGVGGPVTSERLGDMARSYGFFAGGWSFDSTSYGQEYARMARMLPSRVGFAP